MLKELFTSYAMRVTLPTNQPQTFGDISQRQQIDLALADNLVPNLAVYWDKFLGILFRDFSQLATQNQENLIGVFSDIFPNRAQTTPTLIELATTKAASWLGYPLAGDVTAFSQLLHMHLFGPVGNSLEYFTQMLPASWNVLLCVSNGHGYYLDWVIFFRAFMLAVALAFILAFLAFVLTISTHTIDSEKSSVYECGFDPFKDSRQNFNSKFFIVAILFIIFDVEIIVIYPWAVILLDLNLLHQFFIGIAFLTILGIGLAYEYYTNVLEW